MARKIRFGLELKDGYRASDNIDEIRDHFDYAKIVEYFLNGKLEKWLDDRHYEAEVIALSFLKPDAPDFKEKLCYIFKVDSKSIDADKIMIEDEITIKKREFIRQYTSDEDVLGNIESVATTQEELEKLYKRKNKVIYLCGRDLSISPKYENVKYVGLGNVTVKIECETKINFDKMNIKFSNVKIDKTYLILPEIVEINLTSVTEKKPSVEVIEELFSKIVNIHRDNNDNILKNYEEINDLITQNEETIIFLHESKSRKGEHWNKLFVITNNSVYMRDCTSGSKRILYDDIRLVDRDLHIYYGKEAMKSVDDSLIARRNRSKVSLFLNVMAEICSGTYFKLTADEKNILKGVYLDSTNCTVLDLIK